jgi:hypothetical protein
MILFLSPVYASEIIVNQSVPLTDYSIKDIRAIFSMRKRMWPNNRQIKVYVLPDNNSLHKDFVINKLHLFPHQIRLIWDRLTFSGTGNTPTEVASEQEMLEKIEKNSDAIGYITSVPKNENVRLLKYR